MASTMVASQTLWSHGGTQTVVFAVIAVMLGMKGSNALTAEQFSYTSATRQLVGETQPGPGTHGGSAASVASLVQLASHDLIHAVRKHVVVQLAPMAIALPWKKRSVSPPSTLTLVQSL